ncbi:MAG: hypothetical protein LBI67_03135 [Treponema sp.]|nr:hypothetical protein [Treponema sp.]
MSGGVAAAAFILSLLLGILSGAGFVSLFFRAAGFGVLFFILSCLVFWLLGQFIPELLSGPDDLFDAPGSRVNISVGSGPPEGAFPSGNVDAVDSIDGFVTRLPGQGPGEPDENGLSAVPSGEALDQDDEDGYNGAGPFTASVSDGGTLARPLPAGAKAAADSGEVDLMPDFNTLSEAFLPDSGSPETVVFDVPEPKKPALGASADRNFKGDFDPKELAQAIKTVLKKDDKG